jgi:pilus assembly protein CpaE
MQRVAIVDPTESSRESLRTLLLGVDFVWLEAECARYEYFFDVIQGSVPNLAIVSLDADKNRALQMIGELSIEHPNMPILTISQDHQALLQSLQRGAKYFLTHPVGLEDMLAALRRALGEGNTSISDQPSMSGMSMRGAVTAANSQIIAVVGTRGGVGTTSLAVNLGATLSLETGLPTALVDLDLALGDADIAIEVSGMENISIADLARNIERLDMNFLKRAMARHEGTGLGLLRHPIEIQEVGVLHEGHIERILNLLRISYSNLILDLSKALLPTDLVAMRMADKILMVAQLELSSLRNVVRLMHLLGQEDNLVDRVHVVINRVGNDAMEEGISLKKAEEVIGRQIFWQVPNDPKSVIAARIAGQPLVTHNPKSRAHLAIAGLAQTLMGKSASLPAPEPKAKSGWSLFGKR